MVVNGVITSLTYTPRFSFNGQDTFTYTLTDNGTDNGVPRPLSVTGTITVNVTAVNQPPQFTAGPNQVITEPITAAGTSPAVNWATNILAGPPEATDELTGPTAQTVQFLVTNNNNALFSVQPSISPTGQLTYTVDQYVNGSAVVTVVLVDSAGNVLPDRNSSTRFRSRLRSPKSTKLLLQALTPQRRLKTQRLQRQPGQRP